MTRESRLGWRIWLPSFVMMVCSWLSYLDRQILAVLSPTILADTGMDTATYATVVSAFSSAYMVGNPFWGSVLDYVGVRIGMLIAVGVWSVASASHAWMGGFIGFAVVRAVLGFGEGATFPGGFRTAMDSLPANKRARGIAISYSGGSPGAMVAPVLVVPIAAMYGWRSTFLLTGALGAAWLVLWWWTAKPPYLPIPERRPAKIAWPNLLERRYWALVCAYGLGAFALGPILYLAPLYLNRVMGASQAELGKILWVPPLGWEVGYFVWGWVADRSLQSNQEGTQQPLGLYVMLAILALPIAGATWITSLPMVMVLFFWSMFIASGFVVLSLRYGARMYPAGQTSLVAGMAAGSWSALVAVMLPVLGRWFDQKLYSQTFVFMSVMPALGVVGWWLLMRGRTSSDDVSEVR
ncbi:MAG: MFS transporter [Acidobacteriota bacterium]